MSNKSIYIQEIHPYKQAIFALLGALSFMILGTLLSSIGWMKGGVKLPWVTAGAFILMYSVFNSINSFSTKNMMFYYRDSIFSFIGLVISASGFAYLFSGTPINDAGSFRWIYLTLTIAYFVFIGITTFIRFIFIVLQTEEERLSKKTDDNLFGE